MSIEQIVTDAASLLAVAEVAAGQLANRSTIRLAQVVLALRSSAELVEDDDLKWIESNFERVTPERIEHWQNEISRLAQRGISVCSTGDPSFPANLRMVPDCPPFLFVRGELLPTDVRSLAVVGSRDSDQEAVGLAFEIGSQLAERGVTVVSGLAEGIDTAAHRGALAAGGRTLAIFGTGIERCYPASNRELAVMISDSGACLSQFWPTTSGSKWTFPTRNVVTSGVALGTVVVEAGENSGARLQAIAALKHGKVLFIADHALRHEWARELIGTPGVVAMSSVDDLMSAVEFELDDSVDALV
jgi:DNA processing protein